VVIIIDALRYDFTVPFQPTALDPLPHYYHNGIEVLYETALKQPNNAFLRPFIADPPTTTLVRLKGLTTGTLPTFLEAGSNFAGTAIDEDNMVAQLYAAGRRVVHLGDDTWQSLFPGLFVPNLTHAYDSFNVWDLHTVDDGVNEHLIPLLQTENASKWDVIFGHYLGVDHAGHRYGPDHPAMATKMKQMDETVRQMIHLLDDDTLLVIMGDHGMDSKGDHGGESEDEVQAALWMYSKREVFGRTKEAGTTPPLTAKERPVNQIDLVPTLSLLLGLPIPFNNLGTPIEEAFIGVDGDDVANLALVNRLTAAQIHRYRQEYALVSKPDPASTARLDALWQAANEAWDASVGRLVTSQQWKHFSSSFTDYQQSNLAICKALWAQFDLVSMAAGVSVLLSTLILMAIFARGTTSDTTEMRSSLVKSGIWSMFRGASVGFVVSLFLPAVGRVRASIFVAAMSCIAAWSYTLWKSSALSSLSTPTSVWSYALTGFVLLQSAGFGSNSFTIWEDEILLFFLGTAGLMLLAQSVRLRGAEDRRHGMWHSIMFLVTIRIASMSRLCREEQMPWGQSTYYASATSSTSAPWQLAISWLVALFLPSLTKAYFTTTQSYHGSLPLWVGVGFRLCLLLISIFWTLDAADDGEWLVGIEKETLKSIRMYIAQFVLCIAFGAGTATFANMSPCIGITTRTAVADSSKTTKGAPEPMWEVQRKPQIVVQGTRNLYGSHFAVLPLTVILIPLLLVQKPMGQGVLALTVTAIFSLLEVLHLLQASPPASKIPSKIQISSTTPTTQSLPALGPILLALLGHFTFFKTGHQATLASIQWDSAFIPLRTIRYPWSPLLVMLNTFAGPILCAAAVPAVVLWRRPYSFAPAKEEGKSGLSSVREEGEEISSDESQHDYRRTERNDLLTALARAHLTHILVYATYGLATTILAGHLRRHLMLYRVFCPRWMVGSALLVLAELVGALVWVGGVRWTVSALAGLFGW
jgi:phosphatidylinositol glycan class O